MSRWSGAPPELDFSWMSSMSSLLALVAANSSGGGSIISFLFLPLMLVAAYFLLIRPQRRRQKDQAALQSGLDVGDEIIPTSGVYGFITGFENDIVWVEIDDNIQVRMARAAIQRKIVSNAPSNGKVDASSDVAEEDKSDK